MKLVDRDVRGKKEQREISFKHFYILRERGGASEAAWPAGTPVRAELGVEMHSWQGNHVIPVQDADSYIDSQSLASIIYRQ